VVRRPGELIDQAQASEKAEMIIFTNKFWHLSMKLGMTSDPCRDINPRKLGCGKLVTLSL
jgi:hypothetical protein